MYKKIESEALELLKSRYSSVVSCHILWLSPTQNIWLVEFKRAKDGISIVRDLATVGVAIQRIEDKSKDDFYPRKSFVFQGIQQKS